MHSIFRTCWSFSVLQQPCSIFVTHAQLSATKNTNYHRKSMLSWEFVTHTFSNKPFSNQAQYQLHKHSFQLHCKKNHCGSGCLSGFSWIYFQNYLDLYPSKFSGYIRIFIRIDPENLLRFFTDITTIKSTKNYIVGNFFVHPNISG